MNPEEFLLSESEANVYKFEKLLNSKRKYIESNSSLEATLLSVIEMCETHKGKIRPDLSNDLRKYFRRAVGVNDIIRKILIRKESSCFDKVWKHVLLLLEAANVSLSDDNPKGDDANNTTRF
jgi:hypothetical protein